MDDNLRKAALLLASIPEADSAALMNRLSADQIEIMATATAALDSVSREMQQSLAAELIERQYVRLQSPSTTSQQIGHDDLTTRSADWQPATQSALEQLQESPPEWLAEQLIAELPQTAAVVLCHLDPKVSARTLACLPTETQIQVVRRIADYESASAEVVAEVVSALASRLRLGRLATINNSGGLALVAQIVQRLDRATERALLENLSQDNRPMVDQLLKLMCLLRDRQRVRCNETTTDIDENTGDVEHRAA